MTERKVPLRQCLACREKKDKRTLLRIVRAEDGIHVDPTGRKNGRGAYVCRNITCMETAVKKHLLDKSFGMQVPPETYGVLKEEFDALNG
ncbi:MAG: YlxR family protein [Lachnospiraceae bacterium]|nr:YlxR family protein [Lachnospiraceae bacterium]MBP5253977.1 YlxR family protein [Lachnospiraceae bacterium]